MRTPIPTLAHGRSGTATRRGSPTRRRAPPGTAPPPQTSITAPPGSRKADFCVRAAGVRRAGARAGPASPRLGMFVSGGGATSAGAGVPVHDRRAGERVGLGSRGMPQDGWRLRRAARGSRTGVWIAGADRARLHVGLVLLTWWSPKADVHQHLVRRACPGSGSVVMCCGVAVGLAAIPEQLRSGRGPAGARAASV